MRGLDPTGRYKLKKADCLLGPGETALDLPFGKGWEKGVRPAKEGKGDRETLRRPRQPARGFKETQTPSSTRRGSLEPGEGPEDVPRHHLGI